MKTTKKCASVLAVMVSSAALILTGCSSTPAESDSPTEAQVAAPASMDGRITYCATLDNPPRGSIDESSNEIGFEVDLGEDIAALMGLEVTWLQLPFDGLISTLQAEQCDALVQELFIKPERLEIIDMVPFSRSGQQIVVRTDSDLEGATLKDFSGVKFAVPNGTTIHTLAVEANEELEAEGKDPISLIVLPTTTDTFQQLNSGVVDALGSTTTASAYYVAQSDGAFEFRGDAFGLIETGIGVKKGNDELTSAIQTSLDMLMEDGTYDSLIEKWNMKGSEL